ncbi:MAG: FtsX-like permease family protein, partial [Pseudomonadota bacterium]
QGAVVGRKLADRYGWKIGDSIPLRGTLYPGTWNFTVRGIYSGTDDKVDETMMFMHWQLLAETIKKRTGSSELANQVAVYVVNIKDPSRAAAISQEIDTLFRNSSAETRTETEKAFQLGFVAMSQAILMAIRAVSFVVVLIIMAVMANTMTMTARERLAEYATLRALGFPPFFIVKLLFGESLMIAAIGGAAGIALTFPLSVAFINQTGGLFKVFHVSGSTIAFQIAASLMVGVVAAAWPAWKMSRIDIVQGLRHIA